MDYEVLSDLYHIELGKLALQDWKKLLEIPKGLNSEYKAALRRLKLSDTHTFRQLQFFRGDLHDP